MSLVCSRGSQAHHKVQNTPAFSPRILVVSHTERVVKMFPMDLNEIHTYVPEEFFFTFDPW